MGESSKREVRRETRDARRETRGNGLDNEVASWCGGWQRLICGRRAGNVARRVMLSALRVRTISQTPHAWEAVATTKHDVAESAKSSAIDLISSPRRPLDFLLFV